MPIGCRWRSVSACVLPGQQRPIQIRNLPVDRTTLFACLIHRILLARQPLPKSISIYCEKNCNRYRQKTRSVCNPAAERCISHSKYVPPQVHQTVQSEDCPQVELPPQIHPATQQTAKTCHRENSHQFPNSAGLVSVG